MFSRHPFDPFESSCQERASLRREHAAWQQHVWTCRVCRAELLAVQEVERATESIPAPALSAGFDAHLFARLHREEAPRRLASGARRWLAAYWTAAVLLSVTIALRTDLLTLDRGLYALAALALIWGVVEILPSRAVRRAAALLGS